MKRLLISNPLMRRFRQSQRGQSIVLLAFAFIALVAFVGLVTDVALLFVRYAALRRAVDAAAIAAAGQVREGTDYGEISIAAMQYIELHNLEPDSILVETCETDIHNWRMGTGQFASTGPHPEAAFPPPVSQWMPETELCDWSDPHKLVRVSAQIESPTTFLALLGIPSIRLEATSVSETAVLDVALVIDTSESMSNATTPDDYMGVKLKYITGSDPMAVRPECVGNEAWGGCCNDPGQGLVGDGRMQSNGIFLPNGRIWHDANGNSLYDGVPEDGLANNTYSSSVDPHYNALICQPFKQVRDAARLFIKRLDFVRGDRVVLVTFNRDAVAYDPDKDVDSDGPLRPLIRTETIAIDSLDRLVGIQVNPTGKWNICANLSQDVIDQWNLWAQSDRSTPQPLRPQSYEAYAPCPNTNIGGGILAANDALTDPVDVRREAVWVMIVLSDGAANATDPVSGVSAPQYGFAGYCPWSTFCWTMANSPDKDPYSAPWENTFTWPECTANNPSNPNEPGSPYCQDDDPNTRHFCLDWSTGQPAVGNVECTQSGNYDADDYARDMADFAGLAEVAPGVPGNFIAIFTIAFGEEVAATRTGAPLLRYIADAGDNGFIDNNLQEDWRDNGQLDFGDYTRYGESDPCDKPEFADVRKQCGQYYFATDEASLTQVFEDIASRMFTRLSR